MVVPQIVTITRILIPRIDAVIPEADVESPHHDHLEAFIEWVIARVREFLETHSEVEIQYDSGHVERLSLMDDRIASLEAEISPRSYES